MARFYKRAAWSFFLAVLLVAVTASWLIVSPPALLLVGAGYAAKIVCSNVFLAGRSPESVMHSDVQAPGHPLLEFLRESVDRSERTVTVRFLGLFAPGYAAYREGFGCTTVPDGDFLAARQSVSDVGTGSFAPIDEASAWPEGEAASPDPAITSLLADPELVGPGMRAVVVVRDGRIVGEVYGEGFSAGTPLLGWSMAKTVNAALAGILIRGGRLSGATTQLFPEWRGDARARITLSDLLAMQSGLSFNEDYGTVTDVTRMLFLEPDMSRFAISFPLDGNPGETFNYSSGTAMMLSRIWMSALDDRWQALTFPVRALFGPLGMRSAVLETDETGIFVGSSFMYATARDWARFAQFLLNDGMWGGNRFLPEGFVKDMGSPTNVSGGIYSRAQTWIEGPGKLSNAEAGLPQDTFWMLGHDGQSAAIVPSKRLAVIRLGLTPSKGGYRPQPLVRRIIEEM